MVSESNLTYKIALKGKESLIPILVTIRLPKFKDECDLQLLFSPNIQFRFIWCHIAPVI